MTPIIIIIIIVHTPYTKWCTCARVLIFGETRTLPSHQLHHSQRRIPPHRGDNWGIDPQSHTDLVSLLLFVTPKKQKLHTNHTISCPRYETSSQPSGTQGNKPTRSCPRHYVTVTTLSLPARAQGTKTTTQDYRLVPKTPSLTVRADGTNASRSY